MDKVVEDEAPKPKLPPLPQEAYEYGDKYQTAMPRDTPIPKTCSHKNIKIVSGSELRCGCGVCYTGSNIQRLYKALSSQ